MARWVLALALVTFAMPGTPLVERPSCPEHATQRCAFVSFGHDEYFYTVDGVPLKIKYTDGGYFELVCPDSLTLENSALPRFKSQLHVKAAHLKNCPPPRSSYAGVLAALNVTAHDTLNLIDAGNLTAAHLAGLAAVPALYLRNATLARLALAAHAGLQRLLLEAVRLPPGELRRLPASLRALELLRMATDVPAAALERLPLLADLKVRDSRPVRVALGSRLRVLALQTPGARVASALPAALRSLTLYGWAEPAPVPWSACALQHLNLRYALAEELPADWLRNCTALQELSVTYSEKLRSLNATSLRGALELTDVKLTSCRLTSLPVGLLDDARKLKTLDLSGNMLKELPNGLFVGTVSLQTLILSDNLLTKKVYTSLQAVTSLTSLDLSDNDLKDSCGQASDLVRGVSPLQSLQRLTILRLRRTNTSLICRDWRETMPQLAVLDLSWNNFTSVTYTDLQFRGSAQVSVNLGDNNITVLQYTQDDYTLATAGAETSRAAVALGGLACDCGAYWAARALRERPAHAALRARCADGRELRAVPPRELLCAARGLCARTACSCARRHSGRAAPRFVLRVACERAGLLRLRDVLRPLRAALPAPDDYDWELQLAHNRIADLDLADLPKHVSILNLTDNALSEFNASAAHALLAPGRRVQLAANPLACGCRAADTLLALRASQAALDYAALQCADGSPLAAAPTARCAARAPAAAALAAGAALLTLLAAGALAGLLWHPALRLRLKAALHRRGWLPAAPEADDAGRRFDVFLSFSHGDERFVREQLVARLEGGAAPYRLCVHYRDWAPGGWIPAQIAASVRASRRTVAVVSPHFLRSAWARAEFREAYALALRDARPRLVVVLLDEPAALALDERLRRYLATNTYVRWGDPWFWEKLYLALPRGRGPEPAGAPVAAQPAPAGPGEGPAGPGEGPAGPGAGPARPEPAPQPAGPQLPPPCPATPQPAAGSAPELARLMPPAACELAAVPV